MSLHARRLGAETSPGFHTIGALDLTSRLEECLHVWGERAGDRRRCFGQCGVVLIGELADTPPERGIDWSRTALVDLAFLSRSSER